MKFFLAFIILGHALIHLIGFSNAFRIASMIDLTRQISRTSGMLWLLTTIVFSACFFLFLQKKEYWWLIGIIAVLISQFLIIQNWQAAKYGTIANLIILFAAVISFMQTRPGSFIKRYEAEVIKRLDTPKDLPLLTDKDIEHLPEPVQNYLRYTGSIGRPQVKNLRAAFNGEMKTKLNGNWTDINSQQYNFFDDPARIFYIDSKFYGIAFNGLHLYADNKASMKIRIASLFTVVDAKGDKMNQGETVTLFNDMCLLAPATLISKNIQWELIDPLTVKARFTLKNITISALLFFNRKGELINFISNDRYLSEDGKTYTNLEWSTPVAAYRYFDGRRLVGKAEACWQTEKGPYTYANFSVDEIEYNCASAMIK